ncbi:hypothetical protein Taro_035693, partial [Colocasia esculenta]|nr:hypothetical protein [Colocasia esculenta]
EVWDNCQESHPNGLICLQAKLKAVKVSLRRWNKDVFGDVNQNIIKAAEGVDHLQEAFDANPSEANRMSLNKANALLQQALRIEEIGCFRYLGAPLKCGRLLSSDFKFIIDKVNAKLAGWSSKVLSQAGRAVLIRAVLRSLPIYIASTVNIPKKICAMMDRLCSNFFWQGADGQKKRHWISWKQLQKLVVEGGLSFRSMEHIQVAITAKQIWNITHGNSLWSRYAKQRFLKKHLTHIQKPFPVGISLNTFKKAKNAILSNSRWIIGNGSSTDFLHDVWIGDQPLVHFQYSPNRHTATISASMQEVMSNDNHDLWHSLNINTDRLRINLGDGDDTCVWIPSSKGDFTVSSAYSVVSPHGRQQSEWKKLWHSAIPPKVIGRIGCEGTVIRGHPYAFVFFSGVLQPIHKIVRYTRSEGMRGVGGHIAQGGLHRHIIRLDDIPKWGVTNPDVLENSNFITIAMNPSGVSFEDFHSLHINHLRNARDTSSVVKGIPPSSIGKTAHTYFFFQVIYGSRRRGFGNGVLRDQSLLRLPFDL